MKLKNIIQNKYRLGDSERFQFTKCYINDEIELFSSNYTTFDEDHKILYGLCTKLFNEILLEDFRQRKINLS